MFGKKNVLIFLAGVEFAHTIMHVWLQFGNHVPLKLQELVITRRLNGWAIAINAGITIGLLIWAKKTKR